MRDRSVLRFVFLGNGSAGGEPGIFSATRSVNSGLTKKVTGNAISLSQEFSSTAF